MFSFIYSSVSQRVETQIRVTKGQKMGRAKAI